MALAVQLVVAGAACEVDLAESFGPSDYSGFEMRTVWIEVHGQVRGPDGEPVAGATVEELYAEEDRIATTDEDGRYALWIKTECFRSSGCSTPRSELVAHLLGFRRGLVPEVKEMPDEWLEATRSCSGSTSRSSRQPASQKVPRWSAASAQGSGSG